MKTHKIFLTLTLLALAALAAGCGSDDENKTSLSGNAVDAAFITDMTTHHQGAIQMAEVAQKRAQHPRVRRFADDIISAQNGQISVMKRIGADMRGMNMGHGGHMGMSQSEMGMDMDLPMLRRTKSFDRAFIDMMLPHHQGAVAMARKELAEGSQPALHRIAQETIDAQTKEIAQMHKWRKAW